MCELIYKSIATSEMSEKQLVELLSFCRVANQRNNISGMMIYCEGEFLQILEGERLVLETLFYKIKLDPRHAGIELLHFGEIESRHFSNWSMGFRSVTREELAELPGFNANSVFTSINDNGCTGSLGKTIFKSISDKMQQQLEM